MNTEHTISELLKDRLPDAWQTSPFTLILDSDEIVILLPVDNAADDSAVDAFRSETRTERMDIAEELQEAFRRKVSWGVTSDDAARLFTHIAVPAMTRLRIKERKVLDTLIGSGVARSRSDALAWCVKLVGKNLDSWLGELDEALDTVAAVRQRGPAEG